MVFEKFIRYAGLAVGLKPSARGYEGRLRGLYRIMYSKTISPTASSTYRMNCSITMMPALSAVHAAAPHNAAMHIRLFLGGLRPPRPSRGWGCGEPRFPHTPLREPMFTLGDM